MFLTASYLQRAWLPACKHLRAGTTFTYVKPQVNNKAGNLPAPMNQASFFASLFDSLVWAHFPCIVIDTPLNGQKVNKAERFGNVCKYRGGVWASCALT